MSFFRAVIHLLIQNEVYPYITYQGQAGIPLKKSISIHGGFAPYALTLLQIH